MSVLVAYASKHGSTEEIADAIAETMREAGLEVECRGRVVFGGRVPVDPHGPIEKAMAKGIPEQFHDRRDWDQIRAWAADVARELGAAPQAGSTPAR